MQPDIVDKVYNVVLRIVKNPDLACDLSQDALTKILLKQNKYIEQGAFVGWACTIAKRVCMDYYRHKQIQHEPLPEDDKFHNNNLLVYQHDNGNLTKLLFSLPKNQYEVIILRLYYRLQFKQIALLLNTNINTAIGHYRYGLRKLQKLKHLL